MTNLKQLIAAAFTHHWNQYETDGQPVPASQEQVADHLRVFGYQLNLDERSNQKRSDEQEDFKQKTGMIPARGLRFYDYQWADASPEIKDWLLSQSDLPHGRYHLSKTTTQIHSCSLDWYEDCQLIRITDAEWSNPKLSLYYLLNSKFEPFWLSGSSEPIHKLNAQAPIKLNQDNMLSYLIFFCFFVRGEEGVFYILESLDDPLLDALRDIPADNQSLVHTRTVIENTIFPIIFFGINEKGHYLYSGVIYYSNAIFVANFAVHLTGMVAMLDDEPLAADLPFRIEAPLK
jgi:hypothetical protein